MGIIQSLCEEVHIPSNENCYINTVFLFSKAFSYFLHKSMHIVLLVICLIYPTKMQIMYYVNFWVLCKENSVALNFEIFHFIYFSKEWSHVVINYCIACTIGWFFSQLINTAWLAEACAQPTQFLYITD